MSRAVAVALLVAVLAVVFTLMWLGWRRRARMHVLPPLPAVGSDLSAPLLSASARYFGTTVAGAWLDRVVTHGLGIRSPADLTLRGGGIDVERPAHGFRIPVEALRGARRDQGIAGKVVPPHGILVVTWQHGELLLDSGFRLSESERHGAWIAAIEALTKERHG